jgi:hypothetical protein
MFNDVAVRRGPKTGPGRVAWAGTGPGRELGQWQVLCQTTARRAALRRNPETARRNLETARRRDHQTARRNPETARGRNLQTARRNLETARRRSRF